MPRYFSLLVFFIFVLPMFTLYQDTQESMTVIEIQKKRKKQSPCRKKPCDINRRIQTYRPIKCRTGIRLWVRQNGRTPCASLPEAGAPVRLTRQSFVSGGD